MPFVPSATVAGVQLEGVVDNCQTINDLYFSLPGGFILSDLQSLATNLSDWFTLSFASQISVAWSPVGVHVRGLNIPASFLVDISSSVEGSLTTEAAPNNVAACISFRTGIAGRSFRGRNYIPALANDQVNLNTMEPEYMAALKAIYDMLLPGGGALPGGWIWGVLSRFSGIDALGKPIPRAAGVFTPIINTTFVDATVDSMRNRLPGRGK